MIKLEPVTASHKHVNFLHDCYCSKSVQGNFQTTRIMSHEKIVASIQSQNAMLKHVFIIVYDEQYIGYAYFHQSNAFNHSEIGVTVIPAMRRVGLGILAHRVLIARILENYKVQRLMAYVSTSNIAERVILEKLSFQLEGIMRQAGVVDEVFHDIAIYGALKHELEEICTNV